MEELKKILEVCLKDTCDIVKKHIDTHKVYYYNPKKFSERSEIVLYKNVKDDDLNSIIKSELLYKNYWESCKGNTRKLISDFIETIDKDWVKSTRLEYLKKLERAIQIDITQTKFLINKNRILGYDFINSVLEELFERIEKKYKKVSIELAFLKSGKEKLDDFISRDIIRRCREVPIEDLVDVPIINAGNGRKKCRCPFHSEKTASFVIYKENTYHCFGCNESGKNAVDFIMKKNKYSFGEAIEFLKRYSC
jgi:hypothetical protein